MIGPSTVVRGSCFACGRQCEIEIEHDGLVMDSPALHIHSTHCLMCGMTAQRFYQPGAIFEMLRSARYAAA